MVRIIFGNRSGENGRKVGQAASLPGEADRHWQAGSLPYDGSAGFPAGGWGGPSRPGARIAGGPDCGAARNSARFWSAAVLCRSRKHVLPLNGTSGAAGAAAFFAPSASFRGRPESGRGLPQSTTLARLCRGRERGPSLSAAFPGSHLRCSLAGRLPALRRAEVVGGLPGKPPADRNVRPPGGTPAVFALLRTVRAGGRSPPVCGATTSSLRRPK